ncbi:MAG: response regulator [Paenibacillaceae bacterium]
MSYTILVVDDTSFMRKMATDCLKQHGHTVIGEAINGRDGIEKYKKLRPDIVLMDLNMPEMNGIDATIEILRINPQAVLLVCSTSNQQENITEAIAVGAKGYLTKPFDAERLNEVIREYAEPHLQLIQHSENEIIEIIEEIEEIQVIEAEESPMKPENKGNRTNFVTSYLCNWNEEINGATTSYSVICSEKEDKILIEMNDSNQVKQTIQFTFDGFHQLHDWLENHLGAKEK